MTTFDRKTLQRVPEEPTDAGASSFTSLDMDVVSIIVEFLDPLSMIRLASTSRFLRELPLSYETVIRSSILSMHDDEVSNRINALLHWDKEIQTIDLPSPLCLLRMINITRCERCNDKARGLTFGLLFCDSCGENIMGAQLYEFHNPTEAKFWREVSAFMNSRDKDNFTFTRPEYTWDRFLEFHPRESIHSTDANTVAILRRVQKEALEVSCMRICRSINQYFSDLREKQFGNH